jgi:hypothetical protein
LDKLSAPVQLAALVGHPCHDAATGRQSVCNLPVLASAWTWTPRYRGTEFFLWFSVRHLHRFVSPR